VLRSSDWYAVCGAWITAALGTLLHLPILARRIAFEEKVLMDDPQYRATMAGKPRFLPWPTS